LGKSRGSAKRPQAGGGGINKTWLIVGLVVAAFIVGFGSLIYLDNQQRAGAEPPEGVEEFDVSSGVNNHTQGTVDYEQSPPVGGAHNPVWQNQGFYNDPVPNERAVHLLEHGAVWITYSPDLSQEGKDELRDIVESKNCLMASPYADLPAGTPVVASAWGVQIQLNGVDDPNLQRFITAYRQGPQTPEKGAACTGGTSNTA
jgi:hypothetical protein